MHTSLDARRTVTQRTISELSSWVIAMNKVDAVHQGVSSIMIDNSVKHAFQ